MKSLKSGVSDIIGKMITNAIVAENNIDPKVRVFLVFSDETYFEFYGENFTCASGVNRGGGLAEARETAGRRNGAKVTVYPIKNIN